MKNFLRNKKKSWIHTTNFSVYNSMKGSNILLLWVTVVPISKIWFEHHMFHVGVQKAPSTKSCEQWMRKGCWIRNQYFENDTFHSNRVVRSQTVNNCKLFTPVHHRQELNAEVDTVLKRMMPSMKTGLSWVLNCVNIRFYASSAGNELATCSSSSTDKLCGDCEWGESSDDKEKDGWYPDQVPSLIKELLIKILHHWFRHTELTWRWNILNFKLALFQLKCKVWTKQLSKILLDKSGIHKGIQEPFLLFL
jgi:hypothetical protein